MRERDARDETVSLPFRQRGNSFVLLVTTFWFRRTPVTSLGPFAVVGDVC
jgi:hypothetical protein